MEEDERVFIIGQGCQSPWYVGGLCNGLLDRFGPMRVIDTPVSENAITGAAVGAAIAGLRPILVFPRMDFMLYAMDPIINSAAKWHYMFGGAMSVPLVIWPIINRGGSQGAQHSQDFTWLFKRIPGLKVVSPQTPREAKGFLEWAVKDPNPVVYVDDRARYKIEGEVSEEEMAPYRLWRDTGEPFCPMPASEILEEAFFEQLSNPLH
uniref:Putative transketolase domain containing protein n=1 Tax=viral metagenome TaxID=1070528 RepID=A0A6M3KA71_9ZZZZ